MLDNALQKLTDFRQSLYSLFPKRKDAIMNLLDALSTTGHRCKSVVQLSNAFCFERQYSSITDAIADGLPEANWLKTRELIEKEYREPDVEKKPHRFIIDCTPAPRSYAKKLEDRYITHAPNPAPGNKPICVGHQYSVLVASPHDSAAKNKHWIVPLSAQRVRSHEKGNELGMQQIKDYIDELKIDKEFSISVADSLYGTDKCREIATQHDNLVHIFRLRNNRTVYLKPTISENKQMKGRHKEFGEKMKLNSPETHPEYDETIQFTILTRKGKTHTITIKCWKNTLLRGSMDFRSSDHPINLVQISVTNEDGDAVFKRPLWLGVLGQRRHELSLKDIQQAYAERYDIEHFFRFTKGNLLIDAYQTADAQHEELWWKLCLLAYMQLYLSKHIVPSIPQPWERYLPEFKNNDVAAISSPSKTQRGFSKLLQAVGTPAATCVPRGRASGRKLGDVQIKRESCPIVFKTKKLPKSDAESISLDSEIEVVKSNGQEIDSFLELVGSTLKKLNLTHAEFSKMLMDSG